MFLSLEKNFLTKRFLFFLSLVFFITAAFACGDKAIKPATSKVLDLKPTVIMISLDGFRSDYLKQSLMPNLYSLANDGVRSEALVPVFPTKTFPNHYTIVTGLYPENHGMISNKIYDPETRQEFPGDGKIEAKNSFWWGGEPIWVTTELQGQKSATLFWPGSEAEIKGTRPSYWTPYNKGMPYVDRINQILSWLELPIDKRPTLITLYIEEIDIVGHNYGPESAELKETLREVDKIFQNLIQGLRERGIFEQVNLVITSDHGMTSLSENRVIYIDDYIDLSEVRLLEETSLAWVWPNENNTKEIYQKLLNAHPNFKVYLKEEMPEKYHFRNNLRISPIIIIADEGWCVTTHGLTRAFKRAFAGGGTHGYDPDLPSMQGLFIAHGAAFQKNLVIPSFQNLNVYNLVSRVLNLKPAPNDGCLDCFENMLKQ
ncbi:MAG: alkaline phosphatase family protein [Acidobacteria bacterium]|nr:alkaline phosphatase family protein [Acidobacteriota bacterium]